MEQRTKICIFCGRERPIEQFGDPTKIIAGRQMCASCGSMRSYAKLVLEFLKAFSFKCSCCGEGHPHFLTLEHIKSVGYKKNKVKTHRAAQLRQAKRENWDRTKYECLCINCNFAKGVYGQCPHRSGVTKEQAIEVLETRASFKVKKIQPTGWHKTPGWNRRRLERNGQQNFLETGGGPSSSGHSEIIQ